MEISTELCDNGDGSLTLTVAGQAQTISGDELDGLTPAAYIEGFCSASGILGKSE